MKKLLGSFIIFILLCSFLSVSFTEIVKAIKSGNSAEVSKYFDNTVTFTQTVNLKSAVKTNITGNIEYMVCNDKECLPPKKVAFDLQLQ